MRLTREFMWERFLARDASFDGRFLTGVTTTGVYCLPSCSARKPRAGNVLFFERETDAQRAGLRACRRCRPSDFLRDRDPDAERLESALTCARRTPERVADVAAFAKLAECGVTKLSELTRAHYHASPLELLTRARLAAADVLLEDTRASVAEIAFAVGFESLSAFHDNFRRAFALSPGDARKLTAAERTGSSKTARFDLALPRGFRADLALEFLGRDPLSPNERVCGGAFERIECLDGRPISVRVEFEPERAVCRLDAERGLRGGDARAVHRSLVRLLALDRDPTAFERRVRRERALAHLIDGREGLRVARAARPYEMLVWTVIAQQVNLSFAFECRRALLERTGFPCGDGRCAHPTPDRVAQLDYGELVKLKLSRAKAEYLIDLSREIVSGALDLDALAEASATRAERELLARRGLGRWSVQSLMMRGFGFADCVPVGDAGLARSLETFFGLDSRPDANRTVELLRPFAPDRSLASFHFWRRLRTSR